jgi:carbamate kinase
MSERYTLPPKWPIPLDVCVSWTQAELGYYLTKELHNQLRQKGIESIIMAVNTTVVVDGNDPAFLNPTKYVGNFFDKADAEVLSDERGWEMKIDSNRGYRRVVPSPKPIRIIEEDAIRSLVEGGALVMCGGGGGIPVAEEDGVLRGIEAVIDKDYTACLLAMRLGLKELVICTAVDNVYLNFGTPEAVPLETVTLEEARQYLSEGQFPPGSMGPKVEALIRFVEDGGERAILTRLENLGNALRGQTGTQFVKGTRSVKFKV